MYSYPKYERRNLLDVIFALDNGLIFHLSKTKCKFMKDGIVKRVAFEMDNYLK